MERREKNQKYKIIFAKAPYRISLFGGGTDFPEWFYKNPSSVISFSINRYATIGLRELPPFFEEKYRIIWSKIETVKKLSLIKHPVVKKILELKKIKHGIEMHHYGDLPARSGVGSSSSFTVCLIGLLNYFLGKKIDKITLAKDAINFERNLLNEIGGWQDQIIVSLGGFKKINFHHKEFSYKNFYLQKKSLNEIEESLVLFYTGFSRNSYEIQKEFKKNLSKLSTELKTINQLAIQAEKIILSEKNYHEIGSLLNESWKIKKTFSKLVSNNRIDQIYETAINSGASGGKLLGAGHNGFMLFYCPKNQQKKLFKSLKKLVHVPFNFDYDGFKIMNKI